MKSVIFLLLTVCGLAELCLAERGDDRWPVREQETIKRTATLSGSPFRVAIDNVDGYVHVRGTNGSDVRITVQRTGSIQREICGKINEVYHGPPAIS